MSPPAPLNRNASLDTIRGLAILLVLIGHYLHVAPFSLLGRPAGAWVQDFGHGGVLLFFMLSGYLIWTTAQDRPAGSFLLRRFAKIAPAYWVNVLGVALLGATIAFFPAFAGKDVLGNLLFLEGSFGVVPLSGVYWTLVVEVKFYLLFALVFYSPLRPAFWLVPFAAAAANLGLFLTLGRASTFFIYLPAFFIGAAIAANEKGQAAQWLIVAIAAVTAAGLAITAPFRGWQAAIFLIVDLAAFIAIYRAGASQRNLAWLGLISYSVYLWHTTLGFPLLERFAPAGAASWSAVLAVVVAAVLLVSWLSYRYVETTFVRIAREMERRGARAT